MTMTRRRIALIALAFAAAGTAGYLLGVHNTKEADWHTTVATVMGEPGDPQVVMDTGEWTYGIEGGQVDWIDEGGVHNSGTWPACLEPRPLDSPLGNKKVTIRFATVEVNAADTGWRPVVMVDCSAAVGKGWNP